MNDLTAGALVDEEPVNAYHVCDCPECLCIAPVAAPEQPCELCAEGSHVEPEMGGEG